MSKYDELYAEMCSTEFAEGVSMEQLTMFEMPKTQGKENKLKRKWENAFQKWSDENGMEGTDYYGCCGFGSMCDWCEDNTYGRPCARALNAMCREEGIELDYTDMDFERIWVEL